MIKKTSQVTTPTGKSVIKTPAKVETPEKKIAKEPEVPAEGKPSKKAEAKVVKVSRKELSGHIREKIMAANAAISAKVAEMVVIAFEESVIEALMEGKQVALLGFGTFLAVDKQEVVRTNPQDPQQKITIPAHVAPRFKPGKQFKVALNPSDEPDETVIEEPDDAEEE